MSVDRKYVGIILGAGYGTRLQKDIEQDNSGTFSKLLGVSKPLLPITKEKLLIDYWVDIFKSSEFKFQSIFVVTNDTTYPQFAEWATKSSFPLSNIINDGTTTNDNRLGACADIQLVLNTKKEEIGDSDIVIVAGDTLFYDDFNLTQFLRSTPENANAICYYELSDPKEVTKRGIVEVSEETKLVTQFLEKPAITETNSRKACPAFYVYKNSSISLIHRFLDENKDLPLSERDAPGKLVRWLLDCNSPVYAGKVSGRYDIGGLDSYQETLKHFESKI
eukprot:c15731_g1_i2.p1 GENE.c15731_g1_i2~~c15731_g1_i2.p1  ORF type:complete len:287 (+),score=121.70 c15731_g1_i2:32-862(+)